MWLEIRRVTEPGTVSLWDVSDKCQQGTRGDGFQVPTEPERVHACKICGLTGLGGGGAGTIRGTAGRIVEGQSGSFWLGRPLGSEMFVQRGRGDVDVKNSLLPGGWPGHYSKKFVI